jgi:hypothetical protein
MPGDRVFDERAFVDPAVQRSAHEDPSEGRAKPASLDDVTRALGPMSVLIVSADGRTRFDNYWRPRYGLVPELESLDVYQSDLARLDDQTDRFAELEQLLRSITQPYGAAHRPAARSVAHSGRVTRHRWARRPPPGVVRTDETQWNHTLLIERPRKRRRMRARRHDERKLRQFYGENWKTVLQAIDTAYDAVGSLWEEENKTGDMGYGSPERPHWDFNRLEPLAVAAIDRLRAAIADALRIAGAMTLVDSHTTTDLDGDEQPFKSEAPVDDFRPPPGRLITAQPDRATAPPLPSATPQEWAQVGWLAA